MPRSHATVRQVSIAIKEAITKMPETEQGHTVIIELAYDKQKREWNCWVLNDLQATYMIGRGAHPMAAVQNFTTLNNLN